MHHLADLGIFFAGMGTFFLGIAAFWWISLWEKKKLPER